MLTPTTKSTTALVLITSLLLGTAHAATQCPGPHVPNFQFEVNGRSHQFEQLRGKVVVLDFWASWCTPCRKSLPKVDQINRAYDDVIVIGVNSESRQEVDAFTDAMGLSFPTIVDEDGQLGQMFDVEAIPTTVVIDAKGHVIDVLVGYRTDNSLERAIERARHSR